MYTISYRGHIMTKLDSVSRVRLNKNEYFLPGIGTWIRVCCAAATAPWVPPARYEGFARGSFGCLLSDGKHTRFSATLAFFTSLI